ncbi:MAG: GNAT family protein [Candidatus Limnocylindrales bacterium]
MTDPPRPLPILRGERVFLRAPERSDIETFARWLSDGETTSFLSMRAPMSVAMEEQWFTHMLERQGKDAYHFAMCQLESGRAFGTISLFDIDSVNGSAGIGIAIGEKSLWGQGLGTDAMNALLDFGFGQLRLERLWLEVYDYNTRARRSYEKCGFVLEGTERHAIFKHGEYHDMHLMSMLHDEWLALPRKKTWEYESSAGE